MKTVVQPPTSVHQGIDHPSDNLDSANLHGYCLLAAHNLRASKMVEVAPPELLLIDGYGRLHIALLQPNYHAVELGCNRQKEVAVAFLQQSNSMPHGAVAAMEGLLTLQTQLFVGTGQLTKEFVHSPHNFLVARSFLAIPFMETAELSEATLLLHQIVVDSGILAELELLEDALLGGR